MKHSIIKARRDNPNIVDEDLYNDIWASKYYPEQATHNIAEREERAVHTSKVDYVDTVKGWVKQHDEILN